MNSEVRRNTWSRFCKRFSSLNRYRPVSVRVKQNGKKEIEVSHDTPLVGIAITKKGRYIDGIELFTAQPDPERLNQPAVSIKQPVRITSKKDDEKKDYWLMIESDDGSQMKIELSEDTDFGKHRSYVEKLAYSMYERREYRSGGDVDDWLEAERRLDEVAHQLAE